MKLIFPTCRHDLTADLLADADEDAHVGHAHAQRTGWRSGRMHHGAVRTRYCVPDETVALRVLHRSQRS